MRQDHSHLPEEKPHRDELDAHGATGTAAYFKLEALTELHAQVMAVLFLTCAFIIVHYFNITFISVLEASRIFAGFGLLGFFAAYILRRRFRLSLLDGFFYGLFGVAPLGMALFLLLNAQCSETVAETFRVVKTKEEGSGFTCILQNDAYRELWHIRNLDRDEADLRLGRLQLTYCRGLFGYKVLRNREMVR